MGNVPGSSLSMSSWKKRGQLKPWKVRCTLYNVHAPQKETLRGTESAINSIGIAPDYRFPFGNGDSRPVDLPAHHYLLIYWALPVYLSHPSLLPFSTFLLLFPSHLLLSFLYRVPSYNFPPPLTNSSSSLYYNREKKMSNTVY